MLGDPNHDYDYWSNYRTTPSTWEPAEVALCWASRQRECAECTNLSAEFHRLNTLARPANDAYWAEPHHTDCLSDPQQAVLRFRPSGCPICFELGRTSNPASDVAERLSAHKQQHPQTEWVLLKNGGQTGRSRRWPTLAAAESAAVAMVAEEERLQNLRPALVEAVKALIAAYANQDTWSRQDVTRSAKSQLHCGAWGIEGVIAGLKERTRDRIESDEKLRARGTRKHFDIGELLRRDGEGCGLCGLAVAVQPVMDHVVPFAHGGFDGWVNLQIACWECNSFKSDNWAGSLNEVRLSEALAASPTFTGKVRDREFLLSRDQADWLAARAASRAAWKKFHAATDLQPFGGLRPTVCVVASEPLCAP